MRHYYLFGIFILLCYSKISAQTSRIWSFQTTWGDKMLEFNEPSFIKMYESETWKYQFGLPVSVFSNSAGIPLFRDHYYKVVDLPNFKTIQGSDSIYPGNGNSIFLYRNDSIVDLLSLANNYRFKKSRQYEGYATMVGGYLFDSIKLAPSGLYLHAINLGKNAGPIAKNKMLWGDLQTDYFLQDVKRKRNFDYRCCIRMDTGYVIGSYRNEVFGVEDTLFKIPSNQCFDRLSIPIPLGMEVYGKSNCFEAILNYKANRLFFRQNATMGAALNGYIDDDLYKYFGIYYVDLDALTGKAIGEPKKLLSTQDLYGSSGLIEMPNGTYTTWLDMECSPNDSILYYVESNFILDSSDGKRIQNYQYKIKYFDFGSASPFVPKDLLVFQPILTAASPRIELNPYGKLVIIYDQKLDGISNPTYTMMFKTLLNSNNPQGLNSKFDINSFSDIGASYGVSLHLYDYIRLTNSIDYSCKATVSFTNKTDYSLGINAFEWYFTKENGNVVSATGKTPQITYSQSGDYFYKVRGLDNTKANGYSEWYFDTLHIRIPQKPVASFTTPDTLICAWQPVVFTNTSHVNDTHLTNPQKWVWSFGDGQTLTQTNLTFSKTVSHVYTLPGTYSVSLFYSNGYCDSTLVKNQYITVTDAPTPGFIVSQIQGCSPFSVNFTDTASRNITKKEYFFSDLKAWQEITSQQFEHLFIKPGKYYAVQRLYGYSGCITQLDTAWFNVSKGFDASDTSHILVATYTHDFANFKNKPQNILITWTKLDAATQYTLQRNGLTIATVPNGNPLQITDPITRPELLTYTVLALDSCGSKANPGNYGQPILLKGEIIDNNEYAQIQFSPHAQWDEAIEYTLHEIDQGVTIKMATAFPNTEIQDKAYLQENMLEKCYVVEAKTSNGLEAQSNILCLPFKPVVFVPNAISPNDDQLNESFTPQVFGITEYHMQIFNRWGQLIYTGTNGSWIPQKSDLGVFMYTLQMQTIQGNSVHQNGTITVLR